MSTSPALELATEGLTPSAKAKRDEQLERNLAIFELLDGFASELEESGSCPGNVANVIEMIGDSLVDLESLGYLRRRGDISAVREWLQSRATRLRLHSNVEASR